MAPVGPVTQAERIQVIDILRGFAILGILLVSMEFYSNPLQQYLVGYDHRLGYDEPLGLADRLTVSGIRLAAEAKFYPILAFLFGLGIAIQAKRAEAWGTRFLPLSLRRHLTLFVIGLAHAILLWAGDILVLYAVMGAILLIFFRRRSPRALLVWVGVMFVLSFLSVFYVAGMSFAAEQMEGTRRTMARPFGYNNVSVGRPAYQASQVYANGSFAEVTAQRLIDRSLAYRLSIYSVFNMLALSLLGLYAGRRGILQNTSGHVTLFRRVLVWGLLLGISSNVFYAIAMEEASRFEPTKWSFLATLVQVLGSPALALSYIAALTLLLQHRSWLTRLRPLAAVGRMALTNYLLQSLIATTIFYGYGFGLFGQVGPALGLLFTIVIFAAQIPFSVWWLRHFQFGPVEWLWRTLTYLRWQPIRLPGASAR